MSARLVPLALVTLLAGPAHTRPIPAPPARVLAAAARVFAEHGAVIASGSAATAGLVQTAPFTVERKWENDWVQNRVDCGKDGAGVQRAMRNPVELTLTLLVDSTAEGTTATLRATGSSFDRIARGMAATNVAAAAAQGSVPCDLRPTFADHLLDEIAARAVGQ